MTHSKKWVVKLGGSLSTTPELKKWLSVLAANGKGQVIIVPGGGPFADQVRTAQKQWAFDDVTAHKMAILAMEQYAFMLSALEADLVPVRSLYEIDKVLNDQRVALWLPAKMLLNSAVLPTNWDTTSDSIAAWLTNQASATHLLLVKHQAAEVSQTNIDHLQKNGIVDRGFKQFVSDASFETSILGKNDSGTFGVMLA